MITVKLDGGAMARVVQLQGEHLQLVSTAAAAVGSRPGAQLEDGRSLRFKVRRCVRQGEEFAISARLLDVPRSLRRLIEAALASSSQEPT